MSYETQSFKLLSKLVNTDSINKFIKDMELEFPQGDLGEFIYFNVLRDYSEEDVEINYLSQHGDYIIVSRDIEKLSLFEDFQTDSMDTIKLAKSSVKKLIDYEYDNYGFIHIRNMKKMNKLVLRKLRPNVFEENLTNYLVDKILPEYQKEEYSYDYVTFAMQHIHDAKFFAHIKSIVGFSDPKNALAFSGHYSAQEGIITVPFWAIRDFTMLVFDNFVIIDSASIQGMLESLKENGFIDEERE